MEMSTLAMNNQHAQGLEAPEFDQKTIRKRYRKQHRYLDRMMMDVECLIGVVSTPTIDQHRYQFRDRFLEGFKLGLSGLVGGSKCPRPST